MRVAFSLIGGKGWTGGSHYLKNLLIALREASGGSVEPLLFTGTDRMDEVDQIRPFVSEVITDSRFAESTFPSFMRQVVRKLTDNDHAVKWLFRRWKVDVVFHAGLFGKRFEFPCVNWIADFQHLRLPDMFTHKERAFRDMLFEKIISQSRRLVLSSEAAHHDFRTFFPGSTVLVDTLRFVARVPEDAYSLHPWNTVREYGVPEKFIFLPNQFWKHKNHMAVIRAVRLLRDNGRDIFVVCSGNEQDHRYPGYADLLKAEAKELGIQDHISFLGLIPMDHVYLFMRQAAAVLNPSFFEGWSTTVEETKSLGKRIIVSDISVHREQDPEGGLYFDPASPEDLADKLSTVWDETLPGPDRAMEERARAMMKERWAAFGRTFLNILTKTAHTGPQQTFH